MTSIAMMAQRIEASSACGYDPAHCKFRRILVKSYLIAYREATKCGDDPAEYIRDCTRGSRNLIEPQISGGQRGDPLESVDIKLALERVRDLHGIELSAWNTDRIARHLCAEHWDAEVDR